MSATIPFKRLILRAVLRDVSPIVARLISVSDDLMTEGIEIARTITRDWSDEQCRILHYQDLRQTIMQRKFARHYRRMLPTLLESLRFRSDNRFQPGPPNEAVHGRHFLGVGRRRRVEYLRRCPSRRWRAIVPAGNGIEGPGRVPRREWRFARKGPLLRRCWNREADGSLAFRSKPLQEGDLEGSRLRPEGRSGKITSRTMPSGFSTTASATRDRICIFPSTRFRSARNSRRICFSERVSIR